MSRLVGWDNAPVIVANDDRIAHETFRNFSMALETRYTLWPVGFYLGNAAVGGAMNRRIGGRDWGIYPSKGVHARKTISGITRDVNLNPLGGATLDLLNSTGPASDTVVDTTTSDANGTFTLCDPNGVNCYIVAYKPGSPDVMGTTVNTLTGV